jgi:hypothetical protein
VGIVSVSGKLTNTNLSSLYLNSLFIVVSVFNIGQKVEPFSIETVIPLHYKELPKLGKNILKRLFISMTFSLLE